MKRSVRPEELRLWSMVAATVHPMAGRTVPKPAQSASETISYPSSSKTPVIATASSSKTPARATPSAAKPVTDKLIEPRRRHRIAREREPIGAHIDLHGMGQDQARAVLEGFVLRSWNEGFRAVLVITGKGLRGDGVLRRMTPEWLAGPRLQAAVAGISEAHRQHGGEGALYVALKRRARD